MQYHILLADLIAPKKGTELIPCCYSEAGKSVSAGEAKVEMIVRCLARWQRGIYVEEKTKHGMPHACNYSTQRLMHNINFREQRQIFTHNNSITPHHSGSVVHFVPFSVVR